MKTKEELIDEYVNNETRIRELKKNNLDILTEIRKFYEHQIGEIGKWTEKGRKKNVGGILNPKFEELPNKEHCAVLTSIEPIISVWLNSEVTFNWKIRFREIKKDGTISSRVIRGIDVPEDPKCITWTGEIHKDYKCK